MTRHLEHKTFSIFKAFLIGAITICTRLAYLQIHLNQYLWHKSQNNFLRTEKIVSLRGEIVDSQGKLLATNRPIINLYWQGTGNKKLSDEQRELIASLETILDKPFDETTRAQLQQVERRSKKINLYRNLSLEQLGQITEKWYGNKNIVVDKTSERFYPHGTLASHILGYLTCIDVEATGKMGLESTFDASLKGQYGKLLTMTNSLGITLKRQELLPAYAGEKIQTTLDLTYQQIAESSFNKGQAGTLILMDPQNGDIKALISRPTFDPNLFLKPISFDQWNELQKKHPFLNRAFNACYPPASLFKLISLAAALETHIIEPNIETICKGTITFGRKYGCGRRYGGHGILNIKETMAQSCNILFYHIGKKIDIDVLMNYAHRFGLGEKTGIIFDEKKGLMPTRAWKQAIFHEPWWTGDTLQATIGQTYLLVTPIQITRMISSIFTGYLVTPHIVSTETSTTRIPLNIQPSTRTLLQEAMNAVIMEGTGKDLSSLTENGFTLYAKTGTGQTSNREKRSLGGKHLEHAWSAVYFKYKDEQPLTLIVLIEHAGNASVARACVRRFLSKLAQIREQK